jgi:hypothetical protein
MRYNRAVPNMSHQIQIFTGEQKFEPKKLMKVDVLI